MYSLHFSQQGNKPVFYLYKNFCSNFLVFMYYSVEALSLARLHTFDSTGWGEVQCSPSAERYVSSLFCLEWWCTKYELNKRHYFILKSRYKLKWSLKIKTKDCITFLIFFVLIFKIVEKLNELQKNIWPLAITFLWQCLNIHTHNIKRKEKYS